MTVSWQDTFHDYLEGPTYPACPCPPRRPSRRHRHLEDQDGDDGGETWEIVYTCLVLLVMFVALVSDRIGADSVMLSALTAFAAAEIISLEEALIGFSNEGLMTVMVLFVVAEGISKTGWVVCCCCCSCCCCMMHDCFSRNSRLSIRVLFLFSKARWIGT